MKESSDVAAAGWRTRELPCRTGETRASVFWWNDPAQEELTTWGGGVGAVAAAMPTSRHRGRRGVALTRDRNASSPETGGRQSRGCRCWEMGERSTASLRKS